jgi:hypothetical protein
MRVMSVLPPQIEQFPPFDAVLRALFAEEERHRLPTLRAAIRRRSDGPGGFLSMMASCSRRTSPSSRSRPIMVTGICRPLSSMDAREVEPSIGPRHRRFHAGLNVRVGLNHYYASEAAVGVAVIQPVQGHRRNVMPATGRHAVTLSGRPISPDRLVGRSRVRVHNPVTLRFAGRACFESTFCANRRNASGCDGLGSSCLASRHRAPQARPAAVAR